MWDSKGILTEITKFMAGPDMKQTNIFSLSVESIKCARKPEYERKVASEI
jgi:hypothetical protein